MNIIKDELNKLAPHKEKIIDLFLKIINRNQHHDSIKNVNEALNTYFVEDKAKEFGNVRQKLAVNFLHYCNEIFIKAQISTFTGGNALSDALKEVFKKDSSRRYPNGFFSFFDDANNPNFASMSYPFNFCKLLVDLRNAYNHPNITTQQLTIIYNGGINQEINNDDFHKPDIKACLRAYLYVTEVYQTELQTHFDKETEPDFTKYLQRVQRNFIQRFKKYVKIRLEEDPKLVRNLKEKVNIFGENAPVKRQGTVEELRKGNKISGKRMILWADAGMGKSTTLEYLAYTDAGIKLSNPSENLPIFLQLGLLTEADMTLKQHIWQEVYKDTKDANITQEYILQALSNGKINLFIDALNEIPKDLRARRLKEIDEICKEYPHTFIILSTRHSDQPFADIPVFVLQKMNDDELQTFLQKNTEGKPKVAAIIEQAMNKDEFLKDTLRQYFMFSRLIEIIERGGEVPSSAMKIVDTYLDAIYEREYTEKKDDRFSKQERKYISRLLAELATNIFIEYGEGNPVFTENAAINHFKTCMKEYGFQIDLIDMLQIITQLNILEETEGKYRFFHSRYQEYFCSLYEIINNGE